MSATLGTVRVRPKTTTKPDRPAADYLAALLVRLAEGADSPRVRRWAERLRKERK